MLAVALFTFVSLSLDVILSGQTVKDSPTNTVLAILFLLLFILLTLQVQIINERRFYTLHSGGSRSVRDRDSLLKCLCLKNVYHKGFFLLLCRIHSLPSVSTESENLCHLSFTSLSLSDLKQDSAHICSSYSI